MKQIQHNYKAKTTKPIKKNNTKQTQHNPHLGRHPRVVVQKRDNPSIQTTLLRVPIASQVLRVCLVLLTDPATGARGGSHPG